MGDRCLDENEVWTYIWATPSPSQVKRILAHVERCGECRRVVEHAVKQRSAFQVGSTLASPSVLGGSDQFAPDVVHLPPPEGSDQSAPLPVVAQESYRIEGEHARGGIGRGIGILNALFRQEGGYCWARELSSMRVPRLEPGYFRALHRPEALGFGAFWRLGRARAKGEGRLRG